MPKIYVLTKEGKAEIGHHMAYVLNVRENYGLTEGEIGESQNTLAQRGEPYTARDILYRAFQQKISLYIMAGEWSKLRNMYYTVANFYLRIKDNEEACRTCTLSSSWTCPAWETKTTSSRTRTFSPRRRA